MPFELDLPARNRQAVGRPRTTDLGAIKLVTAIHGLFVHASQVLGNEPDRRVLPKAEQLRVMNVAIRLSPEHGLGKQSFPPQSNESASVEVLRMQAPDSHGG